MEWWIWLLIGVGLLVFEVLIPGGFFAVFFGTGALLTAGLAAAHVIDAAWAQWTAFGFLGTGLLIALRPTVRRRFETGGRDVDQIQADIATAVDPLAPGGRGKVELRGAPWTAEYQGQEPVEPGARLRVVQRDGLTLIVDKER
jgi:membrane protein implicated in regulation of membrane protease activity